MNELTTRGKRRAILIFISILLLSVSTIFNYHYSHRGIVIDKLFQQIIRLGLTVVLMVYTLKGKIWVKNLFTILLALGVVGAIIPLFSEVPFNNKIPFMVMIFIYSVGVYHLNFSRSFKAYFKLYEH